MFVCMFADHTGDREKALGLSVSAMCDRRNNSVADIQIGQLDLPVSLDVTLIHI